MSKRVFLIVLDSFGIGEMQDAYKFGDVGANTLRSVSKSPYFNLKNLKKLGLFNIDGVEFLESEDSPLGAFGRFSEKSMGKDTTVGHWEISGVVSDSSLPTYPNGFPEEVMDEFSKKCGRGVLCNKPYSGTDVLRDYGEEHIKSGDLIVYTSADSVFQIAAHEDVVPIEKLYEYCIIARGILKDEHGVGRVIARPFKGENGSFTRTSNRHDYSLEPPKKTMLDFIKAVGKSTIGVGKINDIFAGRGLSEYVYTSSNADGISRTLQYLDRDFTGLCFVNLVDFDMVYGHRNDVDGYAKALSEFDKALPEIISKLKDDDVLIITADHGCDPGFLKSTDHTREYIPALIFGRRIKNIDLGTTEGFCSIGKTICDYLDVESDIDGESFLSEILKE
ncbi:MAG: phosphopentomutase [Ruminococcaceae bacterium]|nr:phosphopentomutase [Oscillospiraceae bacterium]